MYCLHVCVKIYMFVLLFIYVFQCSLVYIENPLHQKIEWAAKKKESIHPYIHPSIHQQFICPPHEIGVWDYLPSFDESCINDKSS